MGDIQQDLAEAASSLIINGERQYFDEVDDDAQPNVVIDEEFGVEDAELQQHGADAGEKPKKKRKKKSKSKSKKKITGFEEAYQEGPITPEAYEEEKKLYDPELAITDRLQTAIQRFQLKRTLDNERLHIFTSYMSYGGVDTKSKMFGGLDQKDLKELDADDIIQARATSSIPENRKGWKIDFEEVAKGFLYALNLNATISRSSYLPEFFALDTPELVSKATGVLRNFLNYLLYHNVCPEYADNILAARQVVDIAQKELYLVHEAAIWSPGDFNMACSTLFGGDFMGGYTGDAEWRCEDTKETEGVRGVPDDVARKIVMFAIAGAGTEHQALLFRDKATNNTVEGTRLEDVSGFEIVEIIEPDDEVKEFYKESAPDLQVVGKLKAKVWTDPGEPPEDFPPEYYENVERSHGRQTELADIPSKAYDFEFLVDEGLLRLCFIGMKMKADIWELEGCGGLYYFDNVLGVYCSFYTVLNNGLLDGWKEPREYFRDATDEEVHDQNCDVPTKEEDEIADKKSTTSNASSC
ncbi:hypothetical protein KEM54_002992 [Ascosphaera aggregata]|nr:hypothetical protein KEM54_002992 [Ascosphaera aggregata]